MAVSYHTSLAPSILRKCGVSITMSSMGMSRESGHVSVTLVGLIVTAVLLVGAAGFGAWAYMSRQDYKDNSDQKAAAAADKRQAEVEAADATKYAEEEKKPLKSHKAPEQYGGIDVQYPKTWSAYVVEGGSSNIRVDDYFHPGAVPDVGEKENAYALRVQVIDDPYDQIIKSYDGDVRTGKLAASPYALSNVSSVIGTRFDGQIDRKKRGSVIVLPLRTMTIKIWTESPDYVADFNNIILANLSFIP